MPGRFGSRRKVVQSAMPPSQSRRSVDGPMPFRWTNVEVNIMRVAISLRRDCSLDFKG